MNTTIKTKTSQQKKNIRNKKQSPIFGVLVPSYCKNRFLTWKWSKQKSLSPDHIQAIMLYLCGFNWTHSGNSDVCDGNIPEASNTSYFASDWTHLNTTFQFQVVQVSIVLSKINPPLKHGTLKISSAKWISVK